MRGGPLVLAAALALAPGSPAPAAPSFLARVFTDAGDAEPWVRGGDPSAGIQIQAYGEQFQPVYFESAPGIAITGSDLAGGGAHARNGELRVAVRAAQTAQGGTLQFHGTTAEARSELAGDGALFAGTDALRDGIPFVAEAVFIGVPVGEPLTLTVSLEAGSRVGYGFPENGGSWQAEAGLSARMSFARSVATLPPGVTLASAGGGIVDNVWTLPEPAGAAWAVGGALGLLARRRGRGVPPLRDGERGS